MTENKEETSKKAPDWVKSPGGVLDFYANTAHLTWSLDDVRVRFAHLIDSPKTPNPGPGFIGVAEEKVAITFSWRNAVVLRDGLNKLIESYEKTNGPINLEIKLPPAI
jgi:hypothetical protein